MQNTLYAEMRLCDATALSILRRTSSVIVVIVAAK